MSPSGSGRKIPRMAELIVIFVVARGFRSKQAPRIGQISGRSNQRLQKIDKRVR